ncbi:recombinase family protein [Tardiphaga sp.]|jgi:site-specific DNA recombinase|uniref:recombinase family protein n=1 Tax=Tardiphaga sp. TaxID=1926292 RepID=UPI0037D9F923
MATNSVKLVRCAIYTRKSTEHGLDLEFNSLDAQRDACEAYVKSQASQGWRALPQRYDDPAYSGGNLDRPALQQLLKDVDAGKVDVIVVYKIDRLTRSLADFAKLVVAFDAKSISFVAVTQQFNTTSSMGRLTLNVLLSFAQFERELSSERVRDKIAASRRKGKWTGGTVPLGYRAVNKKLIIDKTEAESVRTIFQRYLELKSLSRLMADLESRGIVTKRRQTKVAKYNGGIPFTYGPLANFLKNRIYVGETRYKDKWFPGEHQPIVARETFDAVQDLLKSNFVGRKAHPTASEAILRGKLFDDLGNPMSPTYSVKDGIRYRYYVSTALLRGRKPDVGKVGRVPALDIETIVLDGMKKWLSGQHGSPVDDQSPLACLKSVALLSDTVIVTAVAADMDGENDVEHTLRIAWSPSTARGAHTNLETGGDAVYVPDQALLQSLVRSHAWVRSLQDGSYDSVEALAEANQLHPKVVRLALRLAFLSPAATTAILTGSSDLKIGSLAAIPKSLHLAWAQQRIAWG